MRVWRKADEGINPQYFKQQFSNSTSVTKAKMGSKLAVWEGNINKVKYFEILPDNLFERIK